MFTRIVSSVVVSLAICAFAGSASAQALSPEQQEIWKVEQQQWKMEAAKDMSWIDTLVHPNLRFWETGAPMPRDKASLKQWSRYESETSTVLEQELLPISATITGNVAVAQYYYRVARENDKKERLIVTGHYMDVLIKEGGRWQFVAWAGGDDPKKCPVDGPDCGVTVRIPGPAPGFPHPRRVLTTYPEPNLTFLSNLHVTAEQFGDERALPVVQQVA